jgi:hypothetical protein
VTTETTPTTGKTDQTGSRWHYHLEVLSGPDVIDSIRVDDYFDAASAAYHMVQAGASIYNLNAQPNRRVTAEQTQDAIHPPQFVGQNVLEWGIIPDDEPAYAVRVTACQGHDADSIESMRQLLQDRLGPDFEVEVMVV